MDRLCRHYDGHMTSSIGVVSGGTEPTVSGRINPQTFIWRSHDSAATGTPVAVKITWKYTNHFNRSAYHTVKWKGRKIVYAPVFDGVAGGSPDDVVVHVSESFLVIDPGISG